MGRRKGHGKKHKRYPSFTSWNEQYVRGLIGRPDTKQDMATLYECAECGVVVGTVWSSHKGNLCVNCFRESRGIIGGVKMDLGQPTVRIVRANGKIVEVKPSGAEKPKETTPFGDQKTRKIRLVDEEA